MHLILQAGRTDRKEFVKKRTKLNPHASTSNKEKKRNKNFMMMRHSQNVRTKGKRSFREKQVTHSNRIHTHQNELLHVIYSCEFISLNGQMSLQLNVRFSPACSTGCTPEKEEAAQVDGDDAGYSETITNLIFDCVKYSILKVSCNTPSVDELNYTILK